MLAYCLKKVIKIPMFDFRPVYSYAVLQGMFRILRIFPSIAFNLIHGRFGKEV